MIKLYAHSLFSVAFFVIRFFILDGAASPAYAKAQAHNPASPVCVAGQENRPGCAPKPRSLRVDL